MYTYTIILYGIIFIADELVATKIVRGRTIIVKGSDEGGGGGGGGGATRIRRKLQSENEEQPHMMGKAAYDFPVFSRIPNTKFNCKSFENGYYADVDTSCQVFHICDNGRKTSFLCPNGTIFRQSHLTCDWWFRVDCANSDQYYNKANNDNNKEFNSETALPHNNINNENNKNIENNENNEYNYKDKENQILAESASFARSNDYLNQIPSSNSKIESKKPETSSSKNSISEILIENSSNGPVVYPYETDSKLPNHVLTGMTKEAYDSLFGSEKANDKVKQNINKDEEGLNDIDYTTIDYTTTTTTTESNSDDDLSFKSSSNLRELAQIFSRALSSYLENPEEFRKILSEVRPTEPSSVATTSSSKLEEEKEVLSFSENIKPDIKPPDSKIIAQEINGFMSKEQLDWASTEEVDNSIITRSTRKPMKNDQQEDGLITSDTQSFLSRDNRIKIMDQLKTTTSTEKSKSADLVLLLVNKKNIRNDNKRELLNALINKKGVGGGKDELKSRPSRKTEENTTKNQLKQSDNRAIHLLSSLYSLVNSRNR